jgi:hypothetical protein
MGMLPLHAFKQHAMLGMDEMFSAQYVQGFKHYIEDEPFPYLFPRFVK